MRGWSLDESDGQAHRAPVVSAFDLLYTEHDQDSARLEGEQRPADARQESEQILAQTLREAMSQASGRALALHTQIAPNQGVSALPDQWTHSGPGG